MRRVQSRRARAGNATEGGLRELRRRLKVDFLPAVELGAQAVDQLLQADEPETRDEQRRRRGHGQRADKGQARGQGR